MRNSNYLTHHTDKHSYVINFIILLTHNSLILHHIFYYGLVPDHDGDGATIVIK